jgi:hypothetical protein
MKCPFCTGDVELILKTDPKPNTPDGYIFDCVPCNKAMMVYATEESRWDKESITALLVP